MPQARAGEVTFWYEERGSGEPVLFLHGLTWDHTLWEHQVAALEPEFRCIAVDLIGHGRTGDLGREYSLWDEAEYIAALLEALGVPSAHVVGLSMGGMIAMRLALRHPEKVRSLALLDTDAGPEEPVRAAAYHQLAEAVLAAGWEVVAEQVAAILFGAPYLAVPRQREAAIAKLLANPRESIARHALRAVTERDDLTSLLGQIRMPATVIVGELDAATPPERAERLAAALPGARLVRIPEAGHHTPLERPSEVTEALREHLQRAVAFFASGEGTPYT